MSEPSRARPWLWRVGTPVAMLMCGALLAVSAVTSNGTDLRGGRYTDLASLVRAEKQSTTALNARVADLNEEVEYLSRRLGDREVSRFQQDIESLRDPAGMTAVRGEAVKVTLTDASPEVIDSALAADDEANPNDFIVHQQDIQAVANAMWMAGADAVTIQGQRLITTTGIKCEGNSVTLHGVPYSPPYKIVAVGNQKKITRALEDDYYLEIYRAYANAPGGGVGYGVRKLEDYTAPGYSGVFDLAYAEPIDTEAS